MTSDKVAGALVRAARREASRCSCGRPLVACSSLVSAYCTLAFALGVIVVLALSALLR